MIKKTAGSLGGVAVVMLLWASTARATPCCATASDGSFCENVAGQQGLRAGCLEHEASESCAGGTVDPAVGNTGCLCVRGRCRVNGIPASEADCTEASAAGCCAGGAGGNCS